jgi:hypothetical protein
MRTNVRFNFVGRRDNVNVARNLGMRDPGRRSCERFRRLRVPLVFASELPFRLQHPKIIHQTLKKGWN